jgi:cyclopropane-fatty-acyl-phospholipid synthase
MTAARDRFVEYWQTKSSSLNREAGDAYYLRKASEHLRLLEQTPLAEGLVDFGCGAGELLSKLSAQLTCRIVAIDYSQALLDIARRAIAPGRVELELSSALDYAPRSREAVWMSCGAVNQYSDEAQMTAFMQCFANNSVARELLFFDCIDPARYVLFASGLSGSYLRDRSSTSRLAVLRTYRKLKALVDMLAGARSQCWSLGEMGFGYDTRYWHALERRCGFRIEIVSSLYFEYRYHVLIKK